MSPLSIPSPPPILKQFMIGPLTIHTYALCLLLGMIFAIIITQRRMTNRGAPRGIVLDVVIWAIPLGIVGARVYHVLTHTGDYFFPGANLWNTLAIWDGGNALYGSLIGGALGAFIGCRQHGVKLWSFADALAPAMLVAQATGRLGNWFNQELFGLPTTLPWGLQIDRPNTALTNDHLESLPASTLFHPLFLYEIVWNLIGVAIILILERRLRGRGSELRWGKAFGVYLMWYGLGRSWLEAIRIDPTSDRIFGLPDNVFASFVTIALGLTLFLVQYYRHRGEPEPSVFRPGWVPKPGKNAAKPDDTVDHHDQQAPANVS
ncbi:MAG: prolipoprotein diacylglyceryl transferase [Actinomycetota bacterium]